MNIPLLAAMLAELAMVAPSDPDREYLMRAGWLPLGAEAFTGIEHWHSIERARAGENPVPRVEAVQLQREHDKRTARRPDGRSASND